MGVGVGLGLLTSHNPARLAPGVVPGNQVGEKDDTVLELVGRSLKARKCRKFALPDLC